MSSSPPLLEQHKERHFTAGEVVRDIIIGVSDGLTVPFALAAGLSGASASSSIVLTAGIAEVAAGAISMGLGGYKSILSSSNAYSFLSFFLVPLSPISWNLPFWISIFCTEKVDRFFLVLISNGSGSSW